MITGFFLLFRLICAINVCDYDGTTNFSLSFSLIAFFQACLAFAIAHRKAGFFLHCLFAFF